MKEVFSYLSLYERENIRKLFHVLLKEEQSQSMAFIDEAIDNVINKLQKQFRIPKSWVAFIVFGTKDPKEMIIKWRLLNE